MKFRNLLRDVFSCPKHLQYISYNDCATTRERAEAEFPNRQIILEPVDGNDGPPYKVYTVEA